MVAYYIAEPACGLKVNVKSVKISVVYAKHIRLKTKRLFKLFLVVHLYETFKSKLVSDIRINSLIEISSTASAPMAL